MRHMACVNVLLHEKRDANYIRAVEEVVHPGF